MSQPSKPFTLPDAIEARLREVGCWPVPNSLRDAFVAKLQAKCEALVAGTLKDKKTVYCIAIQVDTDTPEPEAAAPTAKPKQALASPGK